MKLAGGRCNVNKEEGEGGAEEEGEVKELEEEQERKEDVEVGACVMG